MFSIHAWIAAAIELSLDAQRISIALTNKTVEDFEKFFALQMTVGKTVLAESMVAANAVLSAKCPEPPFLLRAEERRRNIAETFAYGRRVTDIVSNICADLNTVAKTQLAETSREIASLADSLAGSVPAGSEHAVALVKSSMANANVGYQELTKMTGHAVELLEGQMMAGANHQFSYKS